MQSQPAAEKIPQQAMPSELQRTRTSLLAEVLQEATRARLSPGDTEEIGHGPVVHIFGITDCMSTHNVGGACGFDSLRNPRVTVLDCEICFRWRSR
jgi:hypothetical protein